MPSKRRAPGEGSVFFAESKDCWIAKAVVGVLPNGKPRYKEIRARSQGEALAKKRQAESEARDGLPADLGNLTLGRYLDNWIEVARPGVQPTTWESYERCVRLHVKPRLGGVKLAQLRPPHIASFFAELQRDGMSGGNAKKVSEVLSTALEHAVRIELIRTSPAAPIAKPKSAGSEIVPFTSDEVMRIRLAAMGNRLEALFALAISTGARQGELLGLGWDCVDFEGGAIRIQRTLAVTKAGFFLKAPKSERGKRVVELPKFAVLALADHHKAMLAEGNATAETVFCTKTGNFIGKSNFIREVYAQLLAQAETPYRKFHTFRHTHVSELLHRGESVVDVARRIGDRPDVILKTYAKFLPGNGERIASRLNDMCG